jgi:transmembrane sensor
VSTHQQLDDLLNRVHEGVALPEDYRQLRNLINEDTSGDVIARVHAFHERHKDPKAGADAYDAGYWGTVVRDILQVDKQHGLDTGKPAMNSAPVHRLHFLRRRWGWIAAAVLVLLAGGTYLFTAKEKQATLPSVTVAKTTPDILPGKNGALLTLDDGSTIVLDSLGDGIVATQQRTQVALKDGKLLYEVKDSRLPATDSRLAFNTLSTPRGSQYQVVLADGTKVWLNAASSLRFPTAFTGAVREIEITGEAYLEVAKNAARPFRVKVNKTTVEVLGTHFNINAYDDEPDVKLTLLEGAVRLTHNAASVTLKPGEQAIASDHAPLTIHHSPDVEKVVAWKNGFFHFDAAQLPVVMRQLSRWYNVEVSYQARPDQNMTFSGKMGRDLRLAQVLKILQKSEVHFAIHDRKIVVIP